MADVNRGKRPLSPHLTIYRPQLTSATSIINRVTGISLLGGGVLFIAWLLSGAISAESYATVNWLMTSWIGDLVMLLSLWALWYHTLAGLRHLYWDSGRGMELDVAEKLGWAVIGGSVVLTVLTVIVI
ncbi:MAG: succinate dehydrogenase, cytochrome b556 subunit [Marinosulfonomonas sp.]